LSTGRAVWHGSCSHEPEQFSSELNNISLELYTVQRCVQVRYTLTKWYQEPGYDKQRQMTRTDTGEEGTIEGRTETSRIMEDMRDKPPGIRRLTKQLEILIEDRIIDFGASFHATYCKEELERFKLRSGNVRLADDKTLDIVGVGDVVLKTSFGTS
ncbi:hypothetical protein Tco_1495919, partial [Tanacetum coccineum]